MDLEGWADIYVPWLEELNIKLPQKNQCKAILIINYFLFNLLRLLKSFADEISSSYMLDLLVSFLSRINK